MKILILAAMGLLMTCVAGAQARKQTRARVVHALRDNPAWAADGWAAQSFTPPLEPAGTGQLTPDLGPATL